MTEPPAETHTSVPNELFDRYLLPKVALAVILAASLVGTWVTGRLVGQWSVPATLLKWSYFTSLGVLTGGLAWKHLFVRPGDLAAGDYCAAMYDRFDRITLGAAVVLVVGGPVVLAGYARTLGTDPPVIALGTLLAVLVGTAVLTAIHSTPAADQFRSPAGLIALALALGVVVATALAEVALRGADPVAATVRVLHLLAFAVWIGGAVWNIFVAVPTGQRRKTVAVVRAAGEQLERFRWAVRFVIPTLLVTGLYQAVDALGVAPGSYLGSVVGLAVLAKVGAIGLLVVIFKLCPMWRACSPIEGVCDLEDLGTGSSGTGGSADD